MKVRIIMYTTEEYTGPFPEFTFCNLVTAWGYIDKHQFAYSELMDIEKAPLGRVPGDFIPRAFEAFDQRRVDIEQANETPN